MEWIQLAWLGGGVLAAVIAKRFHGPVAQALSKIFNTPAPATPAPAPTPAPAQPPVTPAQPVTPAVDPVAPTAPQLPQEVLVLVQWLLGLFSGNKAVFGLVQTLKAAHDAMTVSHQEEQAQKLAIQIGQATPKA